MEKKIVCKVDGRKFATKQAFAQHQRDAHSKSVAVAVKRNPGNRRVAAKPSGGMSDLRQVVVASPQRVVSAVAKNSARVSGTDRVAHFADLSVFEDGSLVSAIAITPAVFKRLAKVAVVFQRIRYKKLVFRVEPQMTASVSGGYVAGFVADPDDVVRNVDQLTAVSGSVTTKWWQGATVSASLPSRALYTSSGVEMREYSPGAFYLFADGKATQKGPLTVFCEWDVELDGSILEAPSAPTAKVSGDVWIRNGHQGVWIKTWNAASKKSDWSSKPTDIIPSSKVGESYRLPYPVSIVKPNDSVLAPHHFVYAQADDSAFLCVNGPGDYYAAPYVVDQIVLTKGTVLEKVTAANSVSSGERQGPSSSDLETMMAPSQRSEDLYGKLETLCQTFLTTLSESLQLRDALKDISDSEEKPS